MLLLKHELQAAEERRAFALVLQPSLPTSNKGKVRLGAILYSRDVVQMEKLLQAQVQEPLTHSSRHSTRPASHLSSQSLELESIRFENGRSGGSCQKLPYKWEPELAAPAVHQGWTGLEKKN